MTRLRSEEVVSDMAVVCRAETSKDQSQGSYICVIFHKTMVKCDSPHQKHTLSQQNRV